jgi:(1->4)-alpha-D-glucan 1-alpha-D-glucosylmutase
MSSSEEHSRSRPRYVPDSTYRLQIHRDFPLAAATAIVPYLARLGAGACYTSPYFTAAPGSTHGYDVADHNEINPEVGGAEAHNTFTAAAAAHGLGHIVDFVPNHMGIGTGNNARWNDVLENGPSAPGADFFDVDWSPVKAELHAKLLLPILGNQYGSVLERGELQLAFTQGTLVLRYFDQTLPINGREGARVFTAAAEPAAAALGSDSAHLNEFLSIITSLQNLPPYTDTDPARSAERQREKEVARTRLARLCSEAPAIDRAIEQAVREFNGTPGNTASFNRLHELLEAQPYRLAYWRTASHEINYRRFFDINTLAGLRVEHKEVFDATHQLLGTLLKEKKVQAVRIDHPDGLFDPARYFTMLQQLAADAWGLPEGDLDRPMYVVAEKILSAGEDLPRDWAVHGTTGYNYLNDLNGLFVDAAQGRRTRRVYAKLTGHNEPFEDVLYAAKRLIVSTAMASELNVLAHILDRIGENNRKSRDFTLDSLRDAITEVVACFPVYRTYVDQNGWRVEDRAVLARAIARARRRNPAMESSIFDFFREVVLPRDPHDEPLPPGHERRDGYPPADEAEAHERQRFSMKFQQYTGPVQAKGLEDTAFYRYNVLISLNEVGGDPSRFGRSVEDFHSANGTRAADWPFEMLTTATHDTKVGEDTRARINAISEMPDDWSRQVSRWMRFNKALRAIVDGEPAPDRSDEYRFYQALVGAWPADLPRDLTHAPDAFVDRLCEYMLKAVREAKVHTSWLTTNQPYEDALVSFVRRSLSGARGTRFLREFLPFQERIATVGMINSLAQLTLKLGSPGVPDIYQGAELWDLSLVDPDNRRPVDFERRMRVLDDVDGLLELEASERGAKVSEWTRNWRDGRIKLLLTAAGLRLRRNLKHVFSGGAYLPLGTEITVPAGAVAFARTGTGEDGATDIVLFIAPRLCCAAIDRRAGAAGGDIWKTSRVMLPPAIAGRTFRHELTGAEIRPTRAGDSAWIFVGEAFDSVPVAILRAV